MTAPASVFTLMRDHGEAALIGVCLIAIVAAIWGSNMNGRHTQSAIDAASAEHVRDSTDAAATEKAKAVLAKENDSALAMVRAQAKIDSIASDARVATATRIADAKLQRSRTTIDTASATSSVTIKTATGDVTFRVLPMVALTWSKERDADTSAIASMKKSLYADSLSIAERDLRLRNDSERFVTLDSIDAGYIAQLKAKSDEIATLSKQKNPRFTAGQGAIAGVIGTLGLILAFAVVF